MKQKQSESTSLTIANESDLMNIYIIIVNIQ